MKLKPRETGRPIDLDSERLTDADLVELDRERAGGWLGFSLGLKTMGMLAVSSTSRYFDDAAIIIGAEI